MGAADEAAFKADRRRGEDRRRRFSAEFARTSPEPEPSELYTDVYLETAA